MSEQAKQPRLAPPILTDHAPARFGWLIWGVFALGVCVATLVKPDLFVLTSGERFEGRIVGESAQTLVVRRTDVHHGEPQTVARSEIVEHAPYGGRSVTPEYRRAAELWWRSENMYTPGEHGFLYFPQAAMLFAPFAVLPAWLGETLWRIFGIAMLAVGVRRVCGCAFGQDWPSAFVWVSAVAVPSAIGSAVNGQTNVHMAGLFALVCADLIGRRWWPVALWLVLALAFKPTSIVMLLLAGALYPRPMAWRLGGLLVVFGAIPLLSMHPGYAADQYHECLVKMSTASEPTDLFQDIRGLLASCGVLLAKIPLLVVRSIAAIGTLGVCWLAQRRLKNPAPAMVLWALGGVYLTLFNPRTEGLTYVLLGPTVAVWAVREVMHRRVAPACFLVFFCLATQFTMQISFGHKNYWIRPLCAAIFGVMIVLEVVRGRDRWSIASAPEQ